MNRKYLLIGASAVVAVAAYFQLKPAPLGDEATSASAEGDALVSITLPPIEGNALIGQRVFENACVACHGVNATGIDGAGPPLIHVIYETNHHADESFQRAVANGVRSHHWQFGDMPPVAGVTRGDVAMVIAYIREIQRANGIN